jgi:hypothetical protein
MLFVVCYFCYSFGTFAIRCIRYLLLHLLFIAICDWLLHWLFAIRYSLLVFAPPVAMRYSLLVALLATTTLAVSVVALCL